MFVFSCQRLLYGPDKNSSQLCGSSVPARSWEPNSVMKLFFAVMTHSMWGLFLALVTKSMSEAWFISSLHKRCYIVPLTNKREVSTNIAESARVVHTLIAMIKSERKFKIRYPYLYHKRETNLFRRKRMKCNTSNCIRIRAYRTKPFLNLKLAYQKYSKQ